MTKIKDAKMDFDDSGYETRVGEISSNSLVFEKSWGNRLGGKLQLHWDSERKLLVESYNWFVDGGDGDVMPESEFVCSYSHTGDLPTLISKYA